MVQPIKLFSRIVPILAALALPTAAFCNGLTLTAAGVADGFTLTTFATTNPGNTGCCSGPFGIAVAANGNIIVSDAGLGQNYVFHDVDGQTIASSISHTPSSSGTQAFATVGGLAYGTNGSQYVQFNNDGTVNHVLTGVPQGAFLGMWGDPTTGHIFASSSSGIININPLANGGLGSSTVIVNTGTSVDGVSVSPDGKTIYAEYNGSLVAYDSTTGAVKFTSTNFGSFTGLDGTGVITSNNSLNGDIVENFNGDGSTTGGIGLFDPSTLTFVAIATGGTRGDYVSPDTTNGTLFLDYSDTVMRLSCGLNCVIGGPPPPSTTPEPGSLTLLGTGMSVLGTLVARRRRKV